MFQYIEVNTEEKMLKLYSLLNKDTSRMARTWVFFLGNKQLGKYFIYYRPKN